MNIRRRTTIAAAVGGLLLATSAGLLVAAEEKHPLPADVGDLSGATEVEVRDAAGQAVLRGRLETDADDNRELEKLARLAPAAGGAGQGKGEAEVEVKRGGAASTLRQEVEVKVEKLAAGATFTVFVDGKQVGTFTTDAQGKGEAEFVSAAAK
jgi:hypothetical protein